MLIDPPNNLEALINAELGFQWEDQNNDVNISAEDLTIAYKKTSEVNYKVANRTKATIVKDETIYYGRIYKLEYNMDYNVKVYLTKSPANVLYNSVLTTIDGKNNIMVKWDGMEDYLYEVAVQDKPGFNSEQLPNQECELYKEKKKGMERSINVTYYATISTFFNGEEDEPLKSGQKYYIKVRTKKINPLNATIIAYSKYVGPVTKRTEFYQKIMIMIYIKVIEKTFLIIVLRRY